MSFIYSVRCNFADPAREGAWNDWYNGPKLAQMIAKPMFRSGQRFKACGMNRARAYFALWVVDSPDAFETLEYTSDWGFFEWQKDITDWSRDLYGPVEGDVTAMMDTGPDERIHMVAFEGLAPESAAVIRDRVAPKLPGMIWMSAVGLDRHSPILGLRRLGVADIRPDPLNEHGIRETLFAPIVGCLRDSELPRMRSGQQN